MERDTRDDLRWKCRWGLLERDLVLERHLLRHGSNLRDLELVLLHELLDHGGNELREIVSGRGERYDPRHAAFVARLRGI